MSAPIKLEVAASSANASPMESMRLPDHPPIENVRETKTRYRGSIARIAHKYPSFSISIRLAPVKVSAFFPIVGKSSRYYALKWVLLSSPSYPPRFSRCVASLRHRHSSAAAYWYRWQNGCYFCGRMANKTRSGGNRDRRAPKSRNTRPEWGARAFRPYLLK